MHRLLFLLFSLVASGCTGTAKLSDRAREHEVAAQMATARGDAGAADRESRAANEDWKKANDRGWSWGALPFSRGF